MTRSIEARYNSARTLRAVFLERYSENGHLVRVESGQLFLARGGKMRWEYEAPEEKLFLADGKLVWFYVPSDRTVTRRKMKESDDWRTPIALLVGKVKFSRFCARVELASEPGATQGNTTLRCLPKNRDSAFTETVIEADSDGRIVRLLIREPGGTETSFQFGDWLENPSLPDSLFRFSTPPGVAIVDADELKPPGPRSPP